MHVAVGAVRTYIIVIVMIGAGLMGAAVSRGHSRCSRWRSGSDFALLSRPFRGVAGFAHFESLQFSG